MKESAAFYQNEYEQGFTTNVPDDVQLRELVSRKFQNSDKDYSIYMAILRALGCKAGDRIYDFGCSWGYGSWQLSQQGYDVTAFEISKPRCAFAKSRLGVNAFDHLEGGGDATFDVFFSAHVLEHVPSVSEVIAYARTKLKPSGLFIAFTPNGSLAFKQKDPDQWQKLWGMVHPNFLDDEFYRKNLPSPLLMTNPYDLSEVEKWRKGTEAASSQRSLGGIELMVASILR